MIAATNDNHTALWGGLDSVDEENGKQEVAQVTDDELLLQAVHPLPALQNDPRVEYEHVDRRSQGPHLAGTTRNRIEIRKLESDGRRAALHSRARIWK